jgi:hypothetical protein
MTLSALRSISRSSLLFVSSRRRPAPPARRHVATHRHHAPGSCRAHLCGWNDIFDPVKLYLLLIFPARTCADCADCADANIATSGGEASLADIPSHLRDRWGRISDMFSNCACRVHGRSCPRGVVHAPNICPSPPITGTLSALQLCSFLISPPFFECRNAAGARVLTLTQRAKSLAAIPGAARHWILRLSPWWAELRDCTASTCASALLRRVEAFEGQRRIYVRAIGHTRLRELGGHGDFSWDQSLWILPAHSCKAAPLSFMPTNINTT